MQVLCLMQELDRVLDGHDVARALAVHDVDHRGEGRGLARTGRAGDHDEAAREPGQVDDDGRQPEFVDVLDLERDHPEDGADGVALHEHVHPEARASRERVRHVELELLLEALAELLRQDRVDHALQRPRRHRGYSSQALQVTVDAHRGRRTRRQVQVRALHLQQPPEQFGDRDLDVGLLFGSHAAHHYFTTLATSSNDVIPIRAFCRPSSRSVIMPCCDRDGLDGIGGGTLHREPFDLFAHLHDLVQADPASEPGVRARRAPWCRYSSCTWIRHIHSG